MTRSAILLCALLAFACSSSKTTTPADAGTSEPPTCKLIFERCHPLDKGTGEIHECHELAEDTASTEAICAAKKDACFAACSADAGVTDAASDAEAHDH
jgi:hypothetical protein